MPSKESITMQIHDNLCTFYVAQYERDSSILKDHLEMEVTREILLRKYEIFLHYGMKKIEDLEEPEKQNLARECRETGIKFTKEGLREACRILHTIKYVLKR